MAALPLSRVLLAAGVVLIAVLSGAVGWGWVQNQRGDVEALERIRELFGPFTASNDWRFSLVDQDGRPVTQESYRGRLMLVYFGYSYCPDICPSDLLVMADAMDLLGNAAQEVQPIFITIDPARDTVEHLAEYVGLFHPRLAGLTGTRDQVDRAVRAFGVRAEKEESARVADYLMEHSTDMYLLDRQGGFIRVFRYGTTAEDIASAIRQYL